MQPEHTIRRLLSWYKRLLGLYPKPYRERFCEGMEQTFNDCLRDRVENRRGLLGYALWMFMDTCGGIMKENMSFAVSHNKRLVIMVIAIAFLLLIPLVAMQFTDEVNWGLGDFIFAAVLLSGAVFVYEVVARMSVNKVYQTAVGIAVVTGLLLVWINGAVGIIGSEDNPANLLYGGVFFVGFLGAAISRFRPQGMAITLFATAIAQALVPVVALIIWQPPLTPVDRLLGILGVFALNAFFVMLFVASGVLFRRAGTNNSPPNRQTV